MLGQFLERPGVAGIVVHTGDGCAHLFIRERAKPANALSRLVRQVQAKSLHQHFEGELLRDQRAAGLRIAQLFFHAFQRPAHRRLVRLFPEMHDWGQRSQQNFGVTAGEDKMAANHVATPVFLTRGQSLFFIAERNVR